jgi:hypothetical protein
MILRTNAIECPACTAWTLEWSDSDPAGSCETCGYDGCRDNADREPASLRVLRQWRYELANPYTTDPTGERGAILRRLRLANCAALADLCGVERMGKEWNAHSLPMVSLTATGGAHFTWKDAR